MKYHTIRIDIVWRISTDIFIVAIAVMIFVGTFSGVGLASQSFTAGNATNAEIGQSSTLHDVSFDIDLADGETTHVEIDTSNLTTGASLTAINNVASTNSNVSASAVGVSSSIANVSVSDTSAASFDPAVTNVTVTLELNTSTLNSESTGIDYSVSEVGGTSGIVTFDLVDTNAPVYESAITGDLLAGGSTANTTVTLNITESGTGINASTVSTSDFTVDSTSPTGTSVTTIGGQPVIQLTVGTALTTEETPVVNLTGSFDDEAGNTLSGPVSKTASDGLSPVITAATYNDTDADGTVDQVTVTYSEAITGSYSDGDWSIPTAGTVSISEDGTGSISSPSVLIDVTGAVNTTGGATKPEVSYSGSSVGDTSSNSNAAQAETVALTDEAAPINVTVEAIESNGDDQIDRLDINYTEDITSSSPETGDYTLGGADAGSVSITGAGTSGTIVQLTVSAPSGTSNLNLTLSYDAAAGTVDSITDGPNPAPSFSNAPVVDVTAPTINTTSILDRDGDGAVDGANVTFSEEIDDSSITASDYAIDGSSIEAVDTLGTIDDDAIQLRITTDANEVDGTDVKNLTYTPGTTADLAGNTLTTVSNSTVTETDGATPIVSNYSLTASGSTLTTTFDVTETLSSSTVDITGPETGSITSFTVSGRTHEGSLSVSQSGDYTGTLSAAADAAGKAATTGQSDTASVSLGGGDSGGSSFILTGVSSRERVRTSTGLIEIGLEFHGSSSSSIFGVTSMSEPGSGLDGTFVAGAEIDVSDSVRGTPARLKVVIDRARLAALGVDPNELVVYYSSDGEWEALSTTTTSVTSSIVVVEVEVPMVDRFVVMATLMDGGQTLSAPEPPEETGTPADGEVTTTGLDEETTEGAATPNRTESDGMPGFTPILTLLAILMTIAITRKRQ